MSVEIVEFAAQVEILEFGTESTTTLVIEVPGPPGGAGPAGADGEDGRGVLLLEANETEPPAETPVGTIIYRKVT